MDQKNAIRTDEINIRTVIKDLIYNIPLVIVAVVTVVMGVSTFKNICYTPEYTSRTTLCVTAKGNAEGNIYSSLNTASSMAEVFSEVFGSTIIREKVEQTFGPIPDDARITSEIIPNTNLLELKVISRDPQSSYKIMQAILQNYKHVSDYVFGNAVLEVIKDPNVPTTPSNQFRTSKLVKIGSLAVVALLCGVIVLISVFRDTVKTEHAARRKLEGRHLATIPYEQKNHTLKGKLFRTNKALILSRQLVSFRYEESFNELAAKMEYKLDERGKQTVLITSVAENEGKSTTCVNLAVALASRNKKVLLIDMDLKKPALARILDYSVKNKYGLQDLYEGKVTADQLLQYHKNLHIYTILSGKGENNRKCLDDRFLRALLDAAKKEFDYIIIDSAPISAGSDTEYLNEFVDTSCLVVHQDAVSVSEINDTIELLKEGKSEFLGYVLNACVEKDVGRSRKYGYGKYAHTRENTAEE